jgi:hypothetical protein
LTVLKSRWTVPLKKNRGPGKKTSKFDPFADLYPVFAFFLIPRNVGMMICEKKHHLPNWILRFFDTIFVATVFAIEQSSLGDAVRKHIVEDELLKI